MKLVWNSQYEKTLILGNIKHQSLLSWPPSIRTLNKIQGLVFIKEFNIVMNIIPGKSV